jgi:hypothetical protein
MIFPDAAIRTNCVVHRNALSDVFRLFRLESLVLVVIMVVIMTTTKTTAMMTMVMLLIMTILIVLKA